MQFAFFSGNLISSYGCWVTFKGADDHPGQGRAVFPLCQSVFLLSPQSAAWPCLNKQLLCKFWGRKQCDAHCIPLPVKPGLTPISCSFSLFIWPLLAWLLNIFLFQIINFFFSISFFNIFFNWMFLSSKLVLLQEESDDHSSCFYTFSSYIWFGLDDHIIIHV